MASPLLEIRDLRVHFETRRGVARAVNEVDLTLYSGERLAWWGSQARARPP